jgi:hypothetical protein
MADTFTQRQIKQRDDKKRRSEKRIAAGLCIRCGEPVVPGRRQCQKHLDYCRTKSRQYYNENPGRDYALKKVRRARRKAQGLCVYCGEPALPGRGQCAAHAEYNNRGRKEKNQATRKRYAETRRCVRCSAPLDDLEGKTCINCSGMISFNR